MSGLERVEDANFRCPQCGAPLRVHQEADVLRFVCRTRHTFSANELLALLEGVIEGRADLTIADKLKLLAEYADLARRLAHWIRRHGLAEPATELEERARQAEQRAWRFRGRLSK
jgi:hypothetical protein